MKSKAVQIFDKKDGFLAPSLVDILEETPNGASYFWCILELDGTANPGQESFFADYLAKVEGSENGLIIKWQDLIEFPNFFYQMWDATVLGSKDKNSLKSYENEGDMYLECDFVIILFDGFWEIHSKDQGFLDRLQKKFRDVKILQ